MQLIDNSSIHVRGGRRTSLLLSSVVFLFLMLAMRQTAQALACGDRPTTSVKLTADLGPCPGDGLIFIGIGVTVDLNGHRILGSGPGTGLVLGNSAVTLKGPGTIENFDIGVLVVAGGSVLYDLTLAGNSTGIAVISASDVRVFDNSIRGGTRGGVGIFDQQANHTSIYRNIISGHSDAGIAVFEGNPLISQNIIRENGVGISTPSLGVATILGNQILNNRTDGILLNSTESGTMIIEDNDIHSNGGNGILLTRDARSALVRDNRITNNRGAGIGADNEGVVGNHRIIGNRLSRNGTDLFWNGTVGACWRQNVFRTSSAAALPECATF